MHLSDAASNDLGISRKPKLEGRFAERNTCRNKWISIGTEIRRPSAYADRSKRFADEDSRPNQRIHTRPSLRHLWRLYTCRWAEGSLG